MAIQQFNGNSTNIQWQFNDHSMAIQWQFNEHSMAIQWQFSNSMAIQWTFNGNSMIIQWQFSNSMAIPRTFNGNSMIIQWQFSNSVQFNEHSMAIQWAFNGNSAIHWQFNEHSMAIQWSFNGKFDIEIRFDIVWYFLAFVDGKQKGESAVSRGVKRNNEVFIIPLFCSKISIPLFQSRKSHYSVIPEKPRPLFHCKNFRYSYSIIPLHPPKSGRCS